MLSISPFIRDGKVLFTSLPLISRAFLTEFFGKDSGLDSLPFVIEKKQLESIDPLILTRNTLTYLGAGYPIDPKLTGCLIASLQAFWKSNFDKSYFIDIGAHDGSVSDGYMLALNHLNHSNLLPKICLVEISEVMCSKLCKKYSNESCFKVILVNKGIKKQSGIMKRYREGNSSEEIYSKLTELKESENGLDNNIQCIRADQLHEQVLKSYGNPTAVRVQVNGGEYEAISSFGDLISDIEILSFTQAAFGFKYLDFTQIHDFLSAKNFVVLRLTPLGFYLLEKPEYVDNKIPFVSNYIAIRNDLYLKYILPRTISQV